MPEHLLAHRAEQETGEAADPACSDDQRGGMGGGLHQRGRSAAVHRPRLDIQVRPGRAQRLRSPVHDCLGRHPAVRFIDSGPAWLPVIAGAAGIGVVMGAALGAAQATVLRRHVRHPWRWIGANAAAWTPAMALIFIGAGLPGAGWPVLAVLVTGTLTGLTAGAVLGLVTGRFLPALGAPARRRPDSPAIV